MAAADGPGATLLMRFPAQRFTRDLVRKALGLLFTVEHKDPIQPTLWQKPEWADKRIDLVHRQRQLFAVLTFWDPPKGGAVGMRTVAQYVIDMRNQLSLPEDGCVWMAVWLQEGNFSPTEPERVQRAVATFKMLVRELEPTFAAVDNYRENMAKRKGKDPRRFAWGAMHYDAEHVERIGVERLRGCAAKIIEEWPDDSMWVQTWENPFIVAKELTQLMEKELGLKELFGGEAPAGAASTRRKKTA